MKFILEQNSWYGDEPVEIELPEGWTVDYQRLPVDQLAPLTGKEIEEKISNPVASKSIRELSENKKEVVILFDDISRPTPIKPLAEAVLKELHAAGIKHKSIRFICALGTHGAHTRIDFEKKLGSDIVREYPVFNHNPYENCKEVGTTSKGTKVAINAEVLKCDLKIGLGSITPHPFNGFGGGAKIIMPGVACINTIEGNHKTAIVSLLEKGLNPVTGMGKLESNGMREEIEEVSKMVGFDFKVDAIVNSKREIVDLFAGDPVKAYYEGANRAAELYATNISADNDVVIVNANAKANEAVIAMYLGAMAVKQSGGDLVVINHTPAGQVPHYLLGPFGRDIGGRMWVGAQPINHVNRVIFFTPYPDYSSGMWFCSEDKLCWANNWEEVLKQLKNHDVDSKAAIIADGTIQYFK